MIHFYWKEYRWTRANCGLSIIWRAFVPNSYSCLIYETITNDRSVSAKLERSIGRCFPLPDFSILFVSCGRLYFTRWNSRISRWIDEDDKGRICRFIKIWLNRNLNLETIPSFQDYRDSNHLEYNSRQILEILRILKISYLHVEKKRKEPFYLLFP